MALINRPMYEQFGARHLGVKGPGALTQLEEGVMGVLPLDLASPAAYWYIQGIRAFSTYHGIAAGGAGTYVKIGLSIETTNKAIIAQITEVAVSLSGSRVDTFRCARTAFSSDPGVYGYSVDTRAPEGQQSQAIIISNNDANQPGQQICQEENDFTEVYKWDRGSPLIVSPGQAIYFGTSTANKTMEVCLKWIELPAYKAEL